MSKNLNTTFFSPKKLLLQTFLRLFLIILLTLFYITNNSDSILPSWVEISFIIISLFLSIFYIVLLNIYKRKLFLLNIQIFFEIILTTGLLFIIPTNTTLILFLYMLTITNSTIIMFRKGAVISAASSSILTLVVIYIKEGYLIDLPIFSQKFITFAGPQIISYIAIYFSYGVIITILIEYIQSQELILKSQREKIFEDQYLKDVIVESIESGMIALDKKGVITFINDKGGYILSNEDRNITFLNSHISLFFKDLKILKTAEIVGKRSEVQYKKQIIGYTINPLKDPKKRLKGYLIVFRDLTEEIQNKKIIKKNERLAYIGQLSASIAHEIRNPLAAISASFQMINKLNKNSSKQINRLTEIGDKEISRLNDLIENFLDYSKFDEIFFEKIDITDALNQIKEFILLKDDIKFIFNIENRYIEGDLKKVYQIFLNIIKNGIEAIESDEKIITINSIKEGNFYKITISDNGIGMEKEIMDKIFLPFNSNKSKGTGLGLAIVEKFMDQHNGYVDLKSKIGIGTKFYLYFPIDKGVYEKR